MGVRLAPLTTLNGTVDADPEATYTAAAALLGELVLPTCILPKPIGDDAPVMRDACCCTARAAFPMP